MKVKCLSVRNPLSYLICAGIKDIEDRSWQTKYRGPIFIHSSGQVEGNWFDFSDYPMPVYNEFYDILDEKGELRYEGKYVGKSGGSLILKDEQNQPGEVQSQWDLIEAISVHEQEHPDTPVFRKRAIVGKADLVDIVTDSPSEWASPGSYHWVMANAQLLKAPILGVKGVLRFWEYNVPDNLELYTL